MARVMRSPLPLARVGAIAICILSAATAAASAQPPSTTQPACPASQPADAATIRAAIATLGHERYSVREQAMAQLIKIGQPVLSQVREKLAEPGLDPELADRLRVVLGRVDLFEGLAAGRFKLVGWSGGEANSQAGTEEVSFEITSLTRTEHGVVARYAWKNGVMVLQQQGRTLAGPWIQDGHVGTIEFTFDEAGQFVTGRWNDATVPDVWERAFLR